MSVEIRATIICNGCGVRIEGPIGRQTTLAGMSYWRASAEAKRQRWMVIPGYGPLVHYCSECADKPQPKKKKVARVS